jgi:hypothetical protein
MNKVFSDAEAKSLTKIQTDDTTQTADLNRRAEERQTYVQTNVVETRILM